MAEAKVNYTEELTAAIVERYTAGEPVEAIAESIGKAVRSVRSKLVREGVYVAAEKPATAKRAEGPTKKEMLNTLESLVPFPVDGLIGATKEAIGYLIAAFTVAEESVDSDESIDSDEPADSDESIDSDEPEDAEAA